MRGGSRMATDYVAAMNSYAEMIAMAVLAALCLGIVLILKRSRVLEEGKTAQKAMGLLLAKAFVAAWVLALWLMARLYPKRWNAHVGI